MPFVSEYPDLPGWKFTITEVSNNVYRIDGRGADGRSVSRVGSGVEEDQLMQACIQDALEMFARAKPEHLEFLTPWEELPDDSEGENRAEKLLSELRREIPSDHTLSRLALRAIAIRRDQDDVLFEILGNEEKFVVVHMTWKKEKDPRWPLNRFFSNWPQWVDAVMIRDHEDYMCGETQVE